MTLWSDEVQAKTVATRIQSARAGLRQALRHPNPHALPYGGLAGYRALIERVGASLRKL